MSFKTARTFPWTILLTLSLMPIESSFAASPAPAPAVTSTSSQKIAQAADADLQRRLQEQREAERVLKEGERLKREVRDNDYNDRGLRQQVGEQINKVRESGSNPQKVREADTELNRLRQQNNRAPYYYNPFYSPYYTVPIILAPYYNINPSYSTPTTTDPAINPPAQLPPQPQIGQNEAARDPKNSNFSLLVSSGFKDGKVAPSVGVRFNNIGFEIAGIFNQDSLPGTVNDFSLPSNFLFNDLGIKKLSSQWGGDVLGFLDVDPRVSVYGSVGLYFQNVGRIAQSQATNDLYKQTDETNVTGAVGGGVAYKAGDNISIGVGYHSLRGVTARMGISF